MCAVQRPQVTCPRRGCSRQCAGRKGALAGPAAKMAMPAWARSWPWWPRACHWPCWLCSWAQSAWPTKRILGCCNCAATKAAGRNQPARWCHTARASAGKRAAAHCIALAAWLQAKPGPSSQASCFWSCVSCSNTALKAQSCPAWQSCCKRGKSTCSPARDRRDSTQSSGEVCGQNSPAGKPEAPSAGAAPWPKTVTCQPRWARLQAALLPASPAPMTKAVPGGALGGGVLRSVQGGSKRACRAGVSGAIVQPFLANSVASAA